METQVYISDQGLNRTVFTLGELFLWRGINFVACIKVLLVKKLLKLALYNDFYR